MEEAHRYLSADHNVYLIVLSTSQGRYNYIGEEKEQSEITLCHSMPLTKPCDWIPRV